MKWRALFVFLFGSASACVAAQRPDPLLIVEEPSGERVYEYGPTERVRYGSAVSVTLATQFPSTNGDGSYAVIRMLLACDGSWSARPLSSYFDEPEAESLNGLLARSRASIRGIQGTVVENKVVPGLAGMFTESAAVRRAVAGRLSNWCNDAFGEGDDYFTAMLQQGYGYFIELGTLAKREGATEAWVHTVPVYMRSPAEADGSPMLDPNGKPFTFTEVDSSREFTRALMAFRCDERTFATRAKGKYTSEGKTLSTDWYRPHEVQFRSMLPQSRAEYLMKVVCRLQRSDL